MYLTWVYKHSPTAILSLPENYVNNIQWSWSNSFNYGFKFEITHMPKYI